MVNSINWKELPRYRGLRGNVLACRNGIASLGWMCSMISFVDLDGGLTVESRLSLVGNPPHTVVSAKQIAFIDEYLPCPANAILKLVVPSWNGRREVGSQSTSTALGAFRKLLRVSLCHPSRRQPATAEAPVAHSLESCTLIFGSGDSPIPRSLRTAPSLQRRSCRGRPSPPVLA